MALERAFERKQQQIKNAPMLVPLVIMTI